MDQHVWDNKIILNELVHEENKGKLSLEWCLSGASKSALRTGFKMGPFYLDAGHSVFNKWDVLLVTHGHADHMFSISSFFLVNEQKSDQKLFAPNANIIKDYVSLALQCNSNRCIKPKGDFYNVSYGEKYDVNIGKDEYRVETIKLVHRVPTVGYGVSKWTNKLNPALDKIKSGMSSKDFSILMKCMKDKTEHKSIPYGIIPPTVKVLKPQFCYLLDTAISGIVDNIDNISKYPIIITECTFYAPDDIYDAEDKQHIHWTQIQPIILKYPYNLWILVHISQKYKTIDCYINDKPENCLIWDS